MSLLYLNHTNTILSTANEQKRVAHRTNTQHNLGLSLYLSPPLSVSLSVCYLREIFHFFTSSLLISSRLLNPSTEKENAAVSCALHRWTEYCNFWTTDDTLYESTNLVASRPEKRMWFLRASSQYFTCLHSDVFKFNILRILVETTADGIIHRMVMCSVRNKATTTTTTITKRSASSPTGKDFSPAPAAASASG